MYVAITSKRAETGFKRRKNVGSMTSSIIFDLRQSQVFALSYLPRRLRRSNQDLSFFDLCRAPSISRVVDLRCIAGFPALFVDLRLIAGFPALFVGLRRIAGILALFGFPALSADLRRVAGFPAISVPTLSSICEIKPRSPASSISFTVELHYYLVFLRHSIESIASLDLSCIECLHESNWI